jgi:hypothetical protein
MHGCIELSNHLERWTAVEQGGQLVRQEVFVTGVQRSRAADKPRTDVHPEQEEEGDHAVAVFVGELAVAVVQKHGNETVPAVVGPRVEQPANVVDDGLRGRVDDGEAVPEDNVHVVGQSSPDLAALVARKLDWVLADAEEVLEPRLLRLVAVEGHGSEVLYDLRKERH